MPEGGLPERPDDAESDENPAELETMRLLELWYREGSHSALGALIERHSAWIRRRVREHLGDQLRARLDSEDIFQDAMMHFLTYGPRVIIHDPRHLKNLWVRMIASTIVDKARYFGRARREIRREQRLTESVVVDLRCDSAEGYSALVKKERKTILRLGLGLLEPKLREVFVLRVEEGLEHRAIAERLGISVSNSQKRYSRAAMELEKIVRRIEEGDFASIVALDPTKH